MTEPEPPPIVEQLQQFVDRIQLGGIGRALARLIGRPTAEPSSRPGLGAIPYPDGTTFRVWAPHAEQVFVTGDFNRWSDRAHPLGREARGGLWSADVPGVQPGHKYKFLVHYDNQVLTRTDPRALDVTALHQNGVVTDRRFTWTPLSTYTPPPREALVIYELHVGTFAGTGEPPFDFDGVINRLPYLQSLGVNAIQLMPITEFAGDFSWGYNPAHPFAVTRTYGGRVALKRLIDAAHQHGIAVILDVVYNHFGPDNLSLWQFDGWHARGLGGIYFYNDWRSRTPWADTRPDYGREEVRAYIVDNVIQWLHEFRVDGLRWDATGYIRNRGGLDGHADEIPDGWRTMQMANDAVKRRYPDRITIAEDMQRNAWVTAPTTTGGAGFDAQWEPRFVHPVREALVTPEDWSRDMTALARAIEADYNGDPFQRVIYTESHDEVANGQARIPHDVQPDQPDSWYARKRAVLGTVLTLTAPGIPMLFQGQEFLEDGWFQDTRPLDWSKARRFSGLVELHRELIHLRRNCDGNSAGLTGAHIAILTADNTANILAYHRWHHGGPGDDVIVIMNWANREWTPDIRFPVTGTWRRHLSTNEARFDTLFTGVVAPDKLISNGDPVAVPIAPYSAAIYCRTA